MQIVSTSIASYLCTLSAPQALKNSTFVFISVSITKKKKKKIFIRCSANQYVSKDSIDFPKGYPTYDRLLPCPLEHVPPRVEHLVVTEGEVVLDYICKALHLPPLYVADLIKFGAVHYALVSPKPPPNATPEQFQIYEQYTDPLVLQKRSSIKGKTFRAAQKTYRITDGSQFVERGTYLRVYVHPKRFPRCYEIDWMSRIIGVTDMYVVLDKPFATSVGGTTNNIEETCVTFASRALALEAPLRTTHQLDNCTEGCVLLAKTQEFCSTFHGMIRENKVNKQYLALTAAPVPIGVISHYMKPAKLAPKLVSEDYTEGWQICKLEVIDCKKISWANAMVEKRYNFDDCGWSNKIYAYECTIKLITGKTHQIRAQLAALGAPIIGDSMYTGAALALLENPNLNPFKEGSKLKYASEEEKFKSIEDWVSCHGKEPITMIGLQASQLSWDEGNCCYEAGPPWWRQMISMKM